MVDLCQPETPNSLASLFPSYLSGHSIRNSFAIIRQKSWQPYYLILFWLIQTLGQGSEACTKKTWKSPVYVFAVTNKAGIQSLEKKYLTARTNQRP